MRFSQYYTDQFVNLLEQCDLSIPNANDLEEIKLYTMSQLLHLIPESIYVFCIDDRKARYILSANTNLECISCLSSFHLTNKYLRSSKQEAQYFFDNWLAFHHQLGQYLFQIYGQSGNQLVKLPAQLIFDLLCDDKLKLMKDVFLYHSLIKSVQTLVHTLKILLFFNFSKFRIHNTVKITFNWFITTKVFNITTITIYLFIILLIINILGLIINDDIFIFVF